MTSIRCRCGSGRTDRVGSTVLAVGPLAGARRVAIAPNWEVRTDDKRRINNPPGRTLDVCGPASERPERTMTTMTKTAPFARGRHRRRARHLVFDVRSRRGVIDAVRIGRFVSFRIRRKPRPWRHILPICTPGAVAKSAPPGVQPSCREIFVIGRVYRVHAETRIRPEIKVNTIVTARRLISASRSSKKRSAAPLLETST